MSATLSRALAALGDEVLDSHEELGDPTLLIRRESALDSLRRLRDDDELEMNFLMDLCAVDYLGREPRFEVVYHLASIDTQPRGGEPSPLRARLRVKAQVGVEEPEIASAVPVWGAANWMEREVYDLYGIRFSGHPDLRRILLYDAFRGHPLRKDYPKRRRQPLVGPRDA